MMTTTKEQINETDIIETTISTEFTYTVGIDVESKDWYLKRLSTNNTKVMMWQNAGGHIEYKVYKWNKGLGEFKQVCEYDSNDVPNSFMTDLFKDYLTHYNLA